MSVSPSKPSGINKNRRRNGEPRGKKLTALPPNATISKRPLARPPIPSPYSGPSNPKVVYVGTKTPFLSAVKRVEKLLKLSDKRLVQSATASTQTRKRRREDEITAIAEEVESKKRKTDEVEEVAIKGTGKAIAKAMELGVWFQEREEEYKVRLVTGSTSSIDDVSWEEGKEGDGGGGEAEETRVRKVSVLEVYVSAR